MDNVWPKFDPESQVRCKNGHVNSDLNRFCPFCGAELPPITVYAACLHPEYRRHSGCTNKAHQESGSRA